MTERRSRRAVAPYGEERRGLANVGPGSGLNTIAGNGWAGAALYGRTGCGGVAAAWTDGRGAAEGDDSALVGLRRRLSGKRAFTRPPTQRPCRSTTHLPGPASSPRSTTPT